MPKSPGHRLSTISDSQEFEYCPLCGAPVTENVVYVGYMKANVQTICPTHGVLVIA